MTDISTDYVIMVILGFWVKDCQGLSLWPSLLDSHRNTSVSPTLPFVAPDDSQASAKTTVQGGIVAYPASDFALRSARMYKAFFGSRKAECRRMDPLTPGEAASARLQAEKPCLVPLAH